jgi:hypothetical protein
MSNGFLFTITSIVDFIILAISVWLGLYILTRNPQKKISWLTCGILWSFGGSFLSSLVYLHAPPDNGVLPWWWGWGVTIAVAFWFHLSVSLISRRSNWKRRWAVILVYFLALNFIAMQTYTNLLYEDMVRDLPLTNNVFFPGTFYPFFSLFLIIILAISNLNFWWARRMSKNTLLQRHILILFAAGCFAILGLIYEFLSTGYGLATPIWPGDLCLGVGAAFLGYGIIQINAIYEGKVIRRDFLFSFIAITFVVVAYLLAAFFSRMTLGVPFVAFIFIILLAIFSHSLVDWARERLEKFFYRSKSHPELRHELREFSRTTTSDHDLKERLSTLLKTLCQTLNVKNGLIAIREGDRFHEAVKWNGDELDHYLRGDHLFGDEIQILEPKQDESGQNQASSIIPLVIGGKQIGAIILGYPTPIRIFSGDDLEILEVFADTVAGVIYGIRLQEEKWQHIQGLMDEIDEREKYLQSRMREVLVKDELHSYLDLKDEAEAISEVEDALRHLNDFATLGDHPLLKLNVVGDYLQVDRSTTITHLDRAKALHQLLVACIEKLKPLSSMPSPPAKEWHQYVILHECYVEGALNRNVMGMLYIGEGTFHRARRKAVKAITRVLAEMEGNRLEEAWSE